MSLRRDPSLDRRPELFFGALAASVTHELNNVLSTIDQAAGMLGDIAARATSGGAVDPGKLETIRARIDRQVRRGVGIVTRFNRFAHSADDADAEFDAGELLENLMGLVGRFADLAKVRLEREEWQGVRGSGDAFGLQETVFTGLRELLAVSSDGDHIAIGLRREGDSGVVSLTGTARPKGVRICFRAAGAGGPDAAKEPRDSEGRPGSDRPDKE